MVVEKFSQGVVNSGIFRLYIATGFFATLIFFVINADLYTPLEMIFWNYCCDSNFKRNFKYDALTNNFYFLV